MIGYTDSLDGVVPNMLNGFFVGWPNPPSSESHRRILEGSDYVELAIDGETGDVIGFITAITDGVSAAYIPHLEVLPTYQNRGVGTKLVQRMLGKLNHLYAIDLMCDPDAEPFYERLGFRKGNGMIIRNYERQNCQL